MTIRLVTIPGGTEGARATVDRIRVLALEPSTAVAQVAATLRASSAFTTAGAIYTWVQQRMLYRPDDPRMEEIKAPDYLLWEIGNQGKAEGDCFPLDQPIIARDRAGRYCLPTLGELERTFDSVEALSYDFAAGVWVWEPIAAWIPKGRRPLVQARLGNGAEFRATPDHRVWTYVGRQPRVLVERALAEIDRTRSAHRRVVVARALPTLQQRGERTAAYLQGLFAAEGYVTGGKVQIAQDRADIRAKLERVLGELGVPYTPSRRRVHAYYTIRESPWKARLRAQGHNSFDMTLPWEALSSSLDVVAALVEGHRDGDAYVPKPGSGWMRAKAIHVTSSHQLAAQLRLALLLLGESVNTYWQQRHGGAGQSPICRLHVWREPLRRPVAEHPTLTYSPIRWMRDAGEAEVADLTIARTHNFVLADGTLVHNCDDYVTLMAALLHAVGINPLIVLVGPADSEEFAHVYLRIPTEIGPIAADAIHEEPFGWEIPPHLIGLREETPLVGTT